MSPEKNWNRGGWMGTAGGGTLWMLLVAIEIAVRTRSVAFSTLAALTAITLLGLAWYLWGQRHSLTSLAAANIFIGAGYPATLAVFAFRQLAGLKDYPLESIGLIITAVFVFLTFEFMFIGRRRGR
jgi:hypothetical protein